MTEAQSSVVARPQRSLGRWSVVMLVALAGGTCAFAVARAGTTPDRPVPVSDRVAMLEQFLALSSDQSAAVHAADPTFIAESARIVSELHDRRQALAALLERPSATDAELRAGLASAMASESALEARVGEFVLRVRPVLDEPQRRQLLGLIARGLTTNAGAHLHNRLP